MTPSAIPARLRFIRERRGYSQSAVGEALNFTQQTIAKWESGTSSPDPESLCRLADLYTISLDELLGHTLVSESPTVYQTTSDRFLGFIQSQPILEAFSLDPLDSQKLKALSLELEKYMHFLVYTQNPETKKD